MRYSASIWTCRGLLALAAAAWLSTAAQTQAQWGSLSGQIVLEGDIPTLKPKVSKSDPTVKDPAVCAVEDIRDYTLTVDPTTKGIADVFVYIRRPTAVHPDRAPVPKEELVVDQKQCQFIPHAMIVRCQQQVIAKSQDPVPHNIHGYNVFNPGFNFTVAANDRGGQKVPIDKANSKAEPLPIPVKCDIHTHMESYWLVIDHPYAAVTDAAGKFQIPDLPVGKNTLTIWHSTSGYVWRTLDVEVTGSGTTLALKVKPQPSGERVKLVPAQ